MPGTGTRSNRTRPDQLLNILLHELQRGDDEPRRAARNLRSLLRQAPDFLDEAAAVVRSPERVWLRVMEQTVAGGMSLLEGVRKFFQAAGPQPGDAALVGVRGEGHAAIPVAGEAAAPCTGGLIRPRGRCHATSCAR